MLLSPTDKGLIHPVFFPLLLPFLVALHKAKLKAVGLIEMMEMELILFSNEIMTRLNTRTLNRLNSFGEDRIKKKKAGEERGVCV